MRKILLVVALLGALALSAEARRLRLERDWEARSGGLSKRVPRDLVKTPIDDLKRRCL